MNRAKKREKNGNTSEWDRKGKLAYLETFTANQVLLIPASYPLEASHYFLPTFYPTLLDKMNKGGQCTSRHGSRFIPQPSANWEVLIFKAMCVYYRSTWKLRIILRQKIHTLLIKTQTNTHGFTILAIQHNQYMSYKNKQKKNQIRIGCILENKYI